MYKIDNQKNDPNFIPKDTDRLLLRHGRCKSFWESETEWTFSGLYVLAFITCSGIIIPGIKLKSWWISREINSRKLMGAADSQTWLNTCMSTVINSQWSAAHPRRISPNCQTKLEFQPKQAGILGERWAQQSSAFSNLLMESHWLTLLLWDFPRRYHLL